jgi:hypothetical protein
MNLLHWVFLMLLYFKLTGTLILSWLVVFSPLLVLALVSIVNFMLADYIVRNKK